MAVYDPLPESSRVANCVPQTGFDPFRFLKQAMLVEAGGNPESAVLSVWFPSLFLERLFHLRYCNVLFGERSGTAIAVINRVETDDQPNIVRLRVGPFVFLTEGSWPGTVRRVFAPNVGLHQWRIDAPPPFSTTSLPLSRRRPIVRAVLP